jgi:zinc protease
MRTDRPWIISASVQTDKTVESIVEILKELNQLKSSKPISKNELQQLVNARTRNLPGRFQTMNSVMKTMVENFKIGMPLNDVTNYEKRYNQLSIKNIQQVITDQMKPKQLVWVVYGDLSKFVEGVRQLNLGDESILEQGL